MKNTINLKNVLSDNIFCLTDVVKVDNLEEGAINFGGATQFDNNCYSFTNETDYATIKDVNRIGIQIPSTIDVNTSIDNTKYVAYVRDVITSYAKYLNIDTQNVEGSWYSEDLGEVVVEESTIIWFEVEKENFNLDDFILFEEICNNLKSDMSQEGISLYINDTLAII